ncbi:MAG: CatB-related O-acetyltransferase [Methyloligellaceae bacterium]
MPRLDPSKKYPMEMPDGTVVKQVVHLNQVIDHPRIKIGDFSYYHHFEELEDYASYIAPYLFPLSPEKLTIGKFCQIAHGVRFITSSANHDMSGFSTYPFSNFMLRPGMADEEVEALFKIEGNKADTVIGNDIWIGMNAVIMPGVVIGDGAIIGTSAVVTKDVAPYSVVAGNPARQVKQRFDEQTVDALLQVKWWDWPVSRIEDNLDAVVRRDLAGLLKVVGAE